MQITLQQAWEEYRCERSSTLCATSLVSDYRQVDKWLSRCPVTELEAGRQVMTWVLTQQPVKSSRRVAMYVRSLYRWASSEDIAYLAKNPIASYRMPKPPQSDEEVIVIARSEVALLLAALAARKLAKGPQWDLFAEFMLQTAMRTGEARAMRWSDIANQKVLVHCNYTLTHGLKNSTKTNRKRTVPLNDRCLEILESLDRHSEYVFPYNRYSFQSFFYDRATELYRSGLTVHRYRPYDLRHTAISRWIEAGIPVAQVAKWAGNSAEVIWKHYCNTTQDYEIPTL